MNESRAITKYVRISPRKARLVANLVRGLPVEEASWQLTHCQHKGGRLIKRTLDSAIANAETQLEAKRETLMISEIRIDEGPTLKRRRSRSRGSQHPVFKRTSHFTVVVKEKEGE